MPKDINPMPPRTFRGGFLFVPLIKKIARRTNRRAIFIVSFFNQFLYLPFSSAFLILAASSAASASRRASRLLSRYSKSSLLPTTSEL